MPIRRQLLGGSGLLRSHTDGLLSLRSEDSA